MVLRKCASCGQMVEAIDSTTTKKEFICKDCWEKEAPKEYGRKLLHCSTTPTSSNELRHL